MEIAILGGGAAGLAAALAAAEQGAHVTVLERNRKPLKKLGVTGNGRANVLNSGAPAYYGDAAFARAVLGRVGYPALCAFFATLGVPLREETEGRVYPAALQAAVVVEALLLRAAQLHIPFLPLTRATQIERTPQGFVLHAVQAEATDDAPRRGKPAELPRQTPFTLRADRVIVAAGGAAAPVHGTDGSAYGLLTGLGHHLTPTRPALCALRVEPRRLTGLTGQRVRAQLTLLAPDGRPLHAAAGEVLFAEDAVSGIAAMQLARFYVPGAALLLDLRPGLGLTDPANGTNDILEALRRLAQQRADRTLGDLLTGVCTAPITRLLCREAGLRDPALPLANLPEAAIRRLAATITGLSLPVEGTRGFDQAQVTAGGIAPADFDPATMQSRLCPGLYAAGEVLDVDGDCGGYNLMFAFASGLLAGRSAAGDASAPQGK
ncbi:MAG: aminoacetone oxidase family FAD-binding enzyme [Candidatus Limiplasma sp.]|nr:aminoacetone oxidase family FAD-binding enzyme [Candidatus Limiplasma sp.]